MIVIPAIDLLGGKAVRLRQGRYDEVTVVDEDPVGRARSLRGRVPWLHVVDLEGARAGRVVEGAIVRAIVEAFGPGVQAGGGVRTAEAFEAYLALGVARVVLGTAAVREPTLVEGLSRAHPGKVVVALDARDGLVAVEGWTETSTKRATDVARALAGLPLAALLYTDIARDGTGQGPNVERTAELARSAPLAVIASGGVATKEHLAALSRCPGVEAAIVGRALYDGSLGLDEAIAAAR